MANPFLRAPLHTTLGPLLEQNSRSTNRLVQRVRSVTNSNTSFNALIIAAPLFHTGISAILRAGRKCAYPIVRFSPTGEPFVFRT